MEEQSETRTLLLNDVAHMSRQVQQLLLLAEVSEEQNYKLENVIVSEVAVEVAEFLKPLAVSCNVEIVILHHSVKPWRADRSALFILLKNLLENAIQHAPKSTLVIAKIESSMIVVRDWGVGVKPDEMKNLFKRFWRGPHLRDQGAGLGLSIYQEIAQNHGWQLIPKLGEPGLEFIVQGK